MKLRICLAALSGAALLLSCTSTPYQETRSPRAARELASALAGRTPGKPVDCIPNYRSTNMQIIDDFTILFHDGRTVYVQNPRGGCRGIASHNNILVTELRGTSQLCSGQINQLVDLQSGIGGGACVFSEFVPYTKPRA